MNTLKKLIILIIPFVLFACKKTEVDHAKIDREIIRKYIADNGLTADSTASGLFYIIETEGTGSNPTINSYLTINYKGYFINGTIFDQTAGTPLISFLNRLIIGWQEGIPLIKKGGRIKLLIPSALGYGSSGYLDIPPNTVLIFEIDLLNFQ